MATRYFINIGSNWNDTANWSATSGGAGGESIPSASDDVFFDANSGSCAVDAASLCDDLNFTGYTGTFSGTASLTISGSLTLATGMTRTYTGDITFNATATGKTLTFDGKTTASTITFNGTGGGWTIQDAWNNGTSSLALTAGSLDTNGQTVTANDFTGSGTSTRGLTLGASTINLRANWLFSTTTNLTFSGSSSTINCTNTSFFTVNFQGGGLTYNAVTLSSNSGGTSNINIVGANTFASLTINGASIKTGVVSVSANQTVSGTLTIAGNSLTNRLLIKSDTLGTARTITSATTTLSNCDFQDITGAGAGSWSGTSIGNALGNTGITFTTPVTRYAVVAGNWSNTATWSASSGGAGGQSVPLCHDTVILDSPSGAGTYTADMPRLGADITCTGFTRTLTTSTTASIFGSLTLASGMTLTASTQAYTFQGRSSHTITSAGKTWAKNLFFASLGGSYTLQDNLITSAWVDISLGTFDANDFNVTGSSILSNYPSSYVRTISMGSGTWTATGTGNVWLMQVSGVIDAETSTVVFSDTSTSSKSFRGGGNTYYNLTITGAGICSYTITSSNSFNKIESTKTVAHSLLFTTGTTQTVADFVVRGTSGNVVTINSTTTGTHTLTKSGGGRITSDYLNIQHSIATPSDTWYAGLNSTDNQAVATAGSGWTFNVPLPTVTTQANSATTDVQSTGNGNITDDGEGIISERGFVYDTVTRSAPSNVAPASSGYASSVIETGTFAEGAYTGTLTGLTGSTTYYVRAYCMNEAGFDYGDEVNFTTSATPLSPTVTTQDVTNKTDTSATGNGTVVDENGTTVTRRGFVVSTTTHSNPSDTDPDVSDYELVFDESGTFIEEAFDLPITGLTTATTYYIRAFAENSVGFNYGDEISFITVGVATVTIQTPTNRQSTTATLNGTVTNDGEGTITARGFNYGTATGVYGTTVTENGSFNEGTFDIDITGLTQNTTYFVRAYATNAIGTAYSSEIQFNTLTFPNTTTMVNSSTTSQSISNLNTTQRSIINQTTTSTVIDNQELQ